MKNNHKNGKKKDIGQVEYQKLLLLKKQKKELKELKKSISDLEKNLELDKKKLPKLRAIRNLKLFGATINFLIPYIITSFVFAGSSRLLGLSYPYKLDKIKSSKFYDIEYDYGELKTFNQYYSNSTEDHTNKLIIYSPWSYDGEYYSRHIKSYDNFKVESADLIKAIQQSNYSYMLENYPDFTDEIQKTNAKIDFNENLLL